MPQIRRFRGLHALRLPLFHSCSEIGQFVRAPTTLCRLMIRHWVVVPYDRDRNDVASRVQRTRLWGREGLMSSRMPRELFCPNQQLAEINRPSHPGIEQRLLDS